MSESLRRKSSSRQLLQNLIRVTAQRSQEDAEEVEREQRRRSREQQRGEGSPSCADPPQHNQPSNNTELNGSPRGPMMDEELKPICRLVLEEDEGFSDWSHRLENRNDQQVRTYCKAQAQRPTPAAQHKAEPEAEKQPHHEEEEEEGCEPEPSCRFQKASTRPPEKMSSIGKEAQTSFSSTVLLPQDAGQRLPDRTSYLAAGKMSPRCVLHSRGAACSADGEEEQEEQLEEEQVAITLAQRRECRSAGTRGRPGDEDDQEEEELSFTHEEKEDLRKEEEIEANRMQDKSSVEGGRSEDVGRRSTVSLCSNEGEELNCYGPMSPTFKKLLIQFYPDEVNSRVSTEGKCKIIERTESLKKSTNSIKKTLPPVPVSKIDKKLEQYAHALEVSSKESRSGSQVLPDLTSQTEPVASKKNLFEAREAWNHNAVSVTQSKDADGLKVGVADLINQWVRGNEDGSRCSSPSKPAENSPGKRYKFVVAGHGKYEKVYVPDNCSEDADCQSAGQYYEDL